MIKNLRLSDKLIFSIVTLGGIGSKMPAPGTWGSLVGLFCAILLTEAADFFLSSSQLLIYILLTFFTCLPLSTFAAHSIKQYQNKNKCHDNSEIIIDELIGMMLVYFIASIISVITLNASLNWYIVIFLFFSFRFFDILKPWPIGYLDKNILTPWGVIIDDVAAALMSVGFYYAYVKINFGLLF